MICQETCLCERMVKEKIRGQDGEAEKVRKDEDLRSY